jgi:RNA polymerase sigma factor (sigma-70 family)
MYEAYADRLYGFCLVLLHDRDEAADAMHDTFVLALQRIDQLRDLDRLHSWLFAIARHVSFRKLEQRKRATPSDIDADVLVLPDDVDADLTAAETSELVWAAAAGLNERDRAVLYLNARGGLEGAELAAALGIEQANPYSLLNRAKAQLERAISALVVARLGRRDCADLATILEGWDGTLTPLLRKRLARHVDECVSCRVTRSRLVQLSALAATPLFLLPKRVDALPRDKTPQDLELIAAHAPLSDEQWQDDGFPPPLDEQPKKRRRRALVLVAFGALGLALLGFGGVVLANNGSARHHTTQPASTPTPTVVRVGDLNATLTPTTRPTTATPTTNATTPTTHGHLLQSTGTQSAGPPPTVIGIGTPTSVRESPPPTKPPAPPTTKPNPASTTVPEQ